MKPPNGCEIVLALFLLFAMSAFSTATSSAPKAASPQECALFADYAITARALNAAGVDEKKRNDTLGAMYIFPDKRIEEIARFIRSAASRSNLGARDFAVMLLETCHGNNGDMDKMLGSGIQS